MTLWDHLAEQGSVRTDVPLAPLTTYRIGGPARYMVVADNEQDLIATAGHLRDSPLPVIVLGRGSNMLVADRGFDGLVVRLGAGFQWIRVGDTVRAGGATPLPQVAREAARSGRGGLEFFVGIPGSVGGAVRMNAGCHGTETADRLIAARVLSLDTGSISTSRPEDLDLSYRHSNLSPLDVIVEAAFDTMDASPEAVEGVMREITRWRRKHQPGGTLNAGSVFKNPSGDSAGRLIDITGLKGLAVGGAKVSERHANFIEVESGARSLDVYRLIQTVRRRVFEQQGVLLDPEVVLVGRFEE